MALTAPYGQNNNMGEYANDAACLTFIRALKWDSTKNGSGTPEAGMEYYDTTLKVKKVYANGAWRVVLQNNLPTPMTADLDLGGNMLILATGYTTGLLGSQTEINWYVDSVLKMKLHKTNGLKLFNTGADITEFSTDGTMGGNSDDAVPTEKAVKTFGVAKSDTRVQSGFVTWIGNGAILGGVYASSRIIMKSADDDCGFKLAFHIPLWFTTGGLKLHIKFYLQTTGTYSVEFHASCFGTGLAIATIDFNVLNADTTHDFSGTANILTDNNFTIMDADIQPGRTFSVSVTSDASNPMELMILDAWIESV